MSVRMIALAGFSAFLLLVVSPCCVVLSVPPGHVGVVRSFGSIDDDPLPAGGPYFVKPWKSVVRLSVQTEKNEEPATVPTKNGLAVKVNAVLLYRLSPDRAAAVLREVGPEFESKVIDPYFRNAVRDACAEFEPEALYTAGRQQLETTVLTKVAAELTPRGFVVESVMLQDPVLPATVTARIESKVAAEQDALRMDFVLRQKRLEADAKVVEAEGIAKAQAIVKKDLDEMYIKYLWVMALRENHSAVIYVPTGTDGMPIFKRVGDLGPEPTKK